MESTFEAESLVVKKQGGQSDFIFPIEHDDIWNLYKLLVEHFWNADDSINQIAGLNLTYEESKFLKQLAAFYVSSERAGFVVDCQAPEFWKIKEAKFFYARQQLVQNVHLETYNRMFYWCTSDDTERSKILKIIGENDAVSEIASWLRRWKSGRASLADQLVVAACLHGLMNVLTLDVVIAWLELRGRTSERQNATNKEYLKIFKKIRFDQSLMSDFACSMVGKLARKPTAHFVNEAIFQAAKLELDLLLQTFFADELLANDANELLRMLDLRTTGLKSKLLQANDFRKGDLQAERAPREQPAQKFSLDDDF